MDSELIFDEECWEPLSQLSQAAPAVLDVLVMVIECHRVIDWLCESL